MTVQEAKELVVIAGKQLVKSGLIARTWGNVSMRISDSHFVITPSGRDYLTLSTDEIVEVAVSDLSYTGSIKPSSEKGIHAQVYKLHPNINFVIHTHQEMASVISAMRLDSIRVSGEFSSLEKKVICADYGLPGTKKLRCRVTKALSLSKGNAIIMKNHGALCFGIDYKEAFRTAHELEDSCGRYIKDLYEKIANKPAVDYTDIFSFVRTNLSDMSDTSEEINSLPSFSSERSSNGFSPAIDNNLLKSIHRSIYIRHKNINNIIHINTPDIVTASLSNKRLLPLLDDFAQIVGTSVKCTELNARQISLALKYASAVMVRGYGALCCGGTKDDALAVSMILKKNCKSLLFATLTGKVRPINPLECMLMRFVYLKKYSKLK